MKKKLLSIIRLAIEIVKIELYGIKATPIVTQYNHTLMRTTVEPTDRLPFYEWVKEFNVSSKAVKRLYISKEQIANTYGITSNFEVIIN